jgi:hypothetical protein
VRAEREPEWTLVEDEPEAEEPMPAWTLRLQGRPAAA